LDEQLEKRFDHPKHCTDLGQEHLVHRLQRIIGRLMLAQDWLGCLILRLTSLLHLKFLIALLIAAQD